MFYFDAMALRVTSDALRRRSFLNEALAGDWKTPLAGLISSLEKVQFKALDPVYVWARAQKIPQATAAAIIAQGRMSDTLPSDSKATYRGVTWDNVMLLWSLGRVQYEISNITTALPQVHGSEKTNLLKYLVKKLKAYGVTPGTAAKIAARLEAGEEDTTPVSDKPKRDRINNYSFADHGHRYEELVAFLNKRAENKGGKWEMRGAKLVLEHPLATFWFAMDDEEIEWYQVSALAKYTSISAKLRGRAKFRRQALAGNAKSNFPVSKVITAHNGLKYKHAMSAGEYATSAKDKVSQTTMKQDIQTRIVDKWPDIEHRILPLVNRYWRALTKSDWSAHWTSGKITPVNRKVEDPKPVKTTNADGTVSWKEPSFHAHYEPHTPPKPSLGPSSR